MDMGLLIDTMRKEMADPLFYTFEMPRELARCAVICNALRMRGSRRWRCTLADSAVFNGMQAPSLIYAHCGSHLRQTLKAAMLACRYMYTHGYNISVPHLVDMIASPLVKKAMLHRTYKTLDSWPTPADYTHALQHSARCLPRGLLSPPACARRAVVGLHGTCLLPYTRLPAYLYACMHACRTPPPGYFSMQVCMQAEASPPPVLSAPCAAVPKLKAIWASFHATYDVDVLVVPATPITARPIDDVEPYVAINGRYVRHHHSPHVYVHLSHVPGLARRSSTCHAEASLLQGEA